MGYRWFQFWFGIRLMLACLAHFNWFTAFFQLKCVYFTMWKSYDLLWFWMHIILCICFPPLRPENFLLVWINLVVGKYRTPNRTFKEIYDSKYNRKLTRFTKSERRLKQLEKEDDDEQDSDSENGDNGLSVIEENPNAPKLLYPAIDKPGPPKVVPPRPIRLEKDSSDDQAFIESGKPDDDKKSQTSKTSGLLAKVVPNILKRKLNLGEKEQNSPDDEEKGSSWQGKIKLQKLIPNKFQRSASNDPEEEEAKKRAKQQRKEEKARKKQIRAERQIELRRLAAIERRRRLVADSIDLMLQCLRSFTSFAILVGNVRKHFLPRPWLSDNMDAFNNPDLLMLFTITISLDVFFFWLTMILTYYRQCQLCCRMGICKFWMWLAILFALGFGVMYTPMHYVHQQLDYTWCDFEPGSDIAQYLTSD
jgi:hypothetical protein